MTIDITPEAVEWLACILEGRGGFVKDATVTATLRALSAALTASQAETAAAYEAGRVDGMRESAAIANTLLVRLTSGPRGFRIVTYSDFVSAIILAAIPKGKDHE